MKEGIGLLLSYVLGSFPTAYIWVKKKKGEDIRKLGSGNIGATNAFRILGFPDGLYVLLIDVAKGMLAVILAYILGLKSWAPWFGLVAIVGHCFPVWLNFKGGKGVATAVGVFLILNPKMTILAILIGGITLLVSGYASMCSLVIVGLLPILSLYFNKTLFLLIPSLLAAALVFYQHRQNIKNLVKGTENKILWK